MSISDFQKLFGPQLNEFVRSPLGLAMLQTLHDQRMLPTCDGAEHQAVYRLGAIAGYEQAEKNILLFATQSKLTHASVSQDYGVKEKPESKD